MLWMMLTTFYWLDVVGRQPPEWAQHKRAVAILTRILRAKNAHQRRGPGLGPFCRFAVLPWSGPFRRGRGRFAVAVAVEPFTVAEWTLHRDRPTTVVWRAMVTARQSKERTRVDALTAEARADPAGFRRKLRRLMWFAGFYVKAVIVLLAVCVVMSIWSIPQGGYLAAGFLLLLSAPALVMLVSMLGAWSKVERGIQLRRSQLPELFDLIDEVRKASGLKALHGIHLSDDFNAMVVVTRRRAVFGRMENHLILGVPLMHALTPLEFRAVVAHECGHLSDNQSQELLAMARMDSLWQNVSTTMAGDSMVGLLFQPFFRWFNPRFRLRSLVWRRQMELEADHEGLLQTDRATAAALEVRLAVNGLKLQELVAAERSAMLRAHDSPPKGLVIGLCRLAATPITEDDEPYLVLALAQSTGWRDSHPALSERLLALGVDASAGEVSLPPQVQESAAERYIGGHIDRLCDAMDDAQRPKIEAFWKHHHARMTHDLEVLRQLDQEARFAELNPQECLQRALLLAQYEPKAARTLAELEAVYASGETGNVELLWALGQARLAADDPTGIELVQESVTLRPDITAEAFETLAAHHARRGATEDAKEALDQATLVREDEHAAAMEARAVNDLTLVEPHRLKAHQLVGVRHPLERHQNVMEAWLVKRQPELATMRPSYILMVRDNLAGTAFMPQKARAELYVTLSQTIVVEGELVVLPLDEAFYGLWRRMMKVPGSNIYLSPGATPYN